MKEKLPRIGSAAAGMFLFAAVGFQQVGLQFISSANSGFITGLYILFVPLIGMFFGHTPNSLWAYPGLPRWRLPARRYWRFRGIQG